MIFYTHQALFRILNRHDPFPGSKIPIFWIRIRTFLAEISECRVASGKILESGVSMFKDQNKGHDRKYIEC